MWQCRSRRITMALSCSSLLMHALPCWFAFSCSCYITSFFRVFLCIIIHTKCTEQVWWPLLCVSHFPCAHSPVSSWTCMCFIIFLSVVLAIKKAQDWRRRLSDSLSSTCSIPQMTDIRQTIILPLYSIPDQALSFYLLHRPVRTLWLDFPFRFDDSR